MSTRQLDYVPGVVPPQIDANWTQQELHRIALAMRALRESAGGGEGGVTDHALLTNRDAADQHPIGAIQGLQAALNAKAAQSALDLLSTTVAGKANAVHTHEIDNVNGLTTALSNKADAVHTHAIADVNGLTTTLSNKADAVHTHQIDNVNGLTTALNGKANVGHGHSIAEVSGLQTVLDRMPDWTFAYRGSSPGQELKSLTSSAKQLLFTTGFSSGSNFVTASSNELRFNEGGTYVVLCDLALACDTAPNNFTIKFEIRSGGGAVIHSRSMQLTFSTTRLNLFTFWPALRVANDRYRFWLTGHPTFTLNNVISNLKVGVVKFK